MRGQRLAPEEQSSLFGDADNEAEDTPKAVSAVARGQEVSNMVIRSPAHLWRLGSFELSFHVRNLQEAAALVGEAQELFRNLAKGYAERLDEVEEFENRVSLAEIELIQNLSGEVDDDTEYDFDQMSSTTAKNIIRILLDKKRSGEKESRSTRSSRGRGSSSRRRSSSRSSSTRRGSSRSSKGNYDNDAPGSITERQKTYVSRELDNGEPWPEDAPDEVDDWTYNQASAFLDEVYGNS